MPADYALVIGINDYTPLADRGLKTLNGAINDADRIEGWLLDPEGGNLDPATCKKIISSPNPLRPLKDDVDDALVEIVRDIDEKGVDARRFYFYFAGHGSGVETNTEDTALCLARWSEWKRNNALSVEGYRKLILRTGYFDEVIFWADCCRTKVDNVMPESSTINLRVNGRKTGRAGYFFGYATRYQDEAFEIENSNGEMRGAFTEVLLKGLAGAAAGADGIVDAQGLKNYLDKETPEFAKQNGFKQKPDVNHSFSLQENCIFSTVRTGVKCQISFTSERVGPVELWDGHATLVRIFALPQAGPVDVNLGKGIYKLVDMATNKFEYFDITLETTEKHVSF